MAGRSRGTDELDALLQATSKDIAAWMLQRADAAGRPTAPLAMADAGSVLKAVEALRRGAVPFKLPTGRGATRDPRPLVEIGLLRDLVGLTYDAAAKLVGTAASRLRARYTLHRAALEEHEGYLDLVARTIHTALTHAFGEDVRRVARDEALPPWDGDDEPQVG